MNKLFYININQIRSEEIFSQVKNHLSDYRLEKTDRCARYNDKLRSAAAGLLIDCGLEFYHLCEKTATYSYTNNGKPSIAGHPEIHFSVSHSGDYVVCAFTSNPVGVDIERVKNVKPSMIKYTCDMQEAAAINLFEPSTPEYNAGFFDVWTKKESFLKFLGIGLKVRPAEINEKFSEKLSQVNFYSFDIAENYKCTLCTEGSRPVPVAVELKNWLK